MTKRWAVLAVVAPGMLALVAARSHGRRQPGEAAPRVESPAAARDEAAARDARLLRTMVAGLAARNQPASAPVAVALVAPAKTAAPAIGGDDASADGTAYASRMEQQFSAQPTARAWSGQARAAIERKLAVLTADAALRSVECRTSMCRVELEHPDLEHYRAFVRQAFDEPDSALWDGPSFSTVVDEDPDGRVLTVSYLSRAEAP